MTVLIDDRAGSRDLIQHPPLDSTGILCRLDSADACFSGNGPNDTVITIGIELKSISDLISSISTGRMQGAGSGQVPRMLVDYDVVWVLYYGRYRNYDGNLQEFKKGKWVKHRMGRRDVPYAYVESFLLTLSALGIKVKHVESVPDAATWISVLYRWWSKPWCKHKGLHTFDNSRNLGFMPNMDAGMIQRARIAAQIPGIGFTRAVDAARYFSSVREMVNATPEEWQRVDGIGKTIAESVDRSLS